MSTYSNLIKQILIVEDHPIFRAGLVQLIKSVENWRILGEVASSWEALAVVRREIPDIILVDISLQDSNGLDLIKDLLREFPHLKILVLSMHDESFYAERALHAGAKGYVMKQAAPTKIFDAIESILLGKIYVSDDVKERLLERMISSSTRDSPSDVSDLSDREFHVFELIGFGYSSREIAEKLNLSVKTIETHKDHLKNKLNLRSSSELRQFAIQWKLSNKV
ncbi:response regulator [Spirochaeta cellobiosiphila]|uniref:response regulator n=1 Tax=Spirochaeta cellobiosiphila TaxID=504483 RepID=UPI0003F5F3BE|nr:response regulator transcription factor [Spirochaeta cellobiosiphila]